MWTDIKTEKKSTAKELFGRATVFLKSENTVAAAEEKIENLCFAPGLSSDYGTAFSDDAC